MKWNQLKNRMRNTLQSITINRKILLTLLAVTAILLISVFIAMNQSNIPPKGESHAPAQETLPHQPEAITPETENPGTEEKNETPGEGGIIDPIPETETIEPTDDAGSIIVEHDLPNDMTHPPAEQYTTHFARWEFACDCKPRASASGAQATAQAGADANLNNNCNGFPVEMDPVLLEKLEALRVALGRPVIITSGVRCEVRNAEVGGIANSRHLSGQAADLYCPGVHYSEVADIARSLGLWVLEYPEEKYCHVEV